MRVGTIVALSVCIYYAAPLAAKERSIAYSSDTRDYKLEYDDSKTKAYEMNQLVWLSPWYDPDQSGPYQMGTSIDSGVVDKIFMVPTLEQGPPVVDVADPVTFRMSAQRNLAYGKQEIATLEALKLPAVLEPVRSYLIDALKYSEHAAQLRFDYNETGDARPLTHALCAECVCQEKQQKVLEQLQNVDSFAARVTRSLAEWPNAMLDCYRSKSGRYPVESWEKFKSQFAIRETHREKGPE